MKLIRLEILSYFWEKVKVYITNELPNIYRYKGNKRTYAELLLVTDMVVGDVWNIEEADVEHDINAGDNLAWNGSNWDNLRGYIDLSDYYKKGEIDNKFSVVDTELKNLDKELKAKFAKAEEDIEKAKQESEALIESTRTELSQDIATNITDVNNRIQNVQTDLNNKKAELDATIADHHDELESTKTDLANTKLNLETTKTNLTNELESTKTNLTNEIESAKTDLTNEINKVKDKITKAEKDINDANIEINKNKASITQHATHLDTVDNSLSDINVSLDAVNARITNEAKRIDVNENTLSTVNTTLDAINARITNEVKRIDANANNITTINTSLDAVNGSITQHATRLNAIDNTISTINTSLDATNTRITNEAKRIDVNANTITVAKQELDGKIGAITDRVEKLDGDTGEIKSLQRQIDATNETITDEINKLTGEPDGVVTVLSRKMDGINKTITDTIAETLDDETSTITRKIQSKLDLLHGTITNEVTSQINDATTGMATESWVGTQINGTNGIIRIAIDKSISDNNKNYTDNTSLAQKFDAQATTIKTAYEKYTNDKVKGLASETWVGTQINGAKGEIETAYKKYTNDKTADMATKTYVGTQISGVEGKITTAVSEEIANQGVVTTTNFSQELNKQKGTIKTIASELITDPATGTTYNFSEIKQKLDSISLFVGKSTDYDAANPNKTLPQIFSALKVQLNAVEIAVANGESAATIVAKINADTSSEVKIKADKIILSGNAIAASLTALNADIDNIRLINAKVTGEIHATSGNFANLYINGQKVYAGKNGSGSGGVANSNMWIDENGILRCKGAYIAGDITAITGHFGNLYIDGNKVYAGKNGSGSCGSDGSSSYFDANGILHCQGAQIQGDVIANSFATNMAKFKVTNNGVVTAVDAKITGEITASKLTITDASFMNRLIVRKVSTADTGKRVSVADNTMTMYDDNNNLRMKVSGDKLAESRNSETINIPLSSYLNRDLTAAEMRNGLDVENIVVVQKTFTVNEGAVLRLPTLVGTVGSYYAEDCNATITTELSLLVNDVEAAYTEQDTYLTASSHVDNNVQYALNGAANYEYQLPGAGTYTFKIIARVVAQYDNVVTEASIATAIKATSMKVYYPAELVEVASNGFRAGFSSDYKAEFAKDNTGKIIFMLRAGDNILRISDLGIQKSTNGGTSWTNL